jgi:hypothetical protein
MNVKLSEAVRPRVRPCRGGAGRVGGRAQALTEAAPAQPRSEFGERKSKEMKVKLLSFPFPNLGFSKGYVRFK